MTENNFENYIERSLEEINKGNVNQVVKNEMMLGAAWRRFLAKFFNLLVQKEILKFEEIEGIASEAFDSLEWINQRREEQYEVIFAEMEARVTELEKRLEEKDRKKQKQN